VTMPPNTLQLRRLGRRDYLPTWQAMRDWTLARNAETLDECWIVEHPPVFTQGQAGKAEHLLAPGDIPVIQTDRGGQVTYHGPGQLVIYTLVDLARRKLGVSDFVHLLEAALIASLAEFGLHASLRAGAPGIYLEPNKIGAIGLRVKRGCCYHGLSLNVAMDLEPFSRIRPCGLSETGTTQLADHIRDIHLNAATDVVIRHLAEVLRYTEVHEIDDNSTEPLAAKQT